MQNNQVYPLTSALPILQKTVPSPSHLHNSHRGGMTAESILQKSDTLSCSSASFDPKICEEKCPQNPHLAFFLASLANKVNRVPFL